ncbi:MAG: STAS domain-containing protein [Candidatus Margulisbacteria bacterium]|nr:STAS domain-containing protein [Candidatus Margulisiibacteriota bacterium]
MEVTKELKEFLIVTLGGRKEGNNVSGQIEIDIDNYYIITETIDNELEKGTINFLLELKNVKYIDSSGFGAILNCYQKIASSGGIFKILNPSEHVKRMLNILKIDM